jgi:hypothetical protein
LKATKTKRKVLAKANEIADQQKTKSRDGDDLLNGKEVMKLLQASVRAKPKVKEAKHYKNSSGSIVVSVDKSSAKEMKVTINRGKNITLDDIQAALGELMKEIH